MDKFGVPKKINRHVLKALYHMKDSGVEKPKFSDIYEFVEYTMKNNVPVSDLPSVLRQSLYNMAELGLINIMGQNCFSINTSSTESSPTKSKRVNSKILKAHHDIGKEEIPAKSKRKAAPSQPKGKTPRRYHLAKTAGIKVHNYTLLAPELLQRLELNEHIGRVVFCNHNFGRNEEEASESSLNTAVKDQFIEELSSVQSSELLEKENQLEENNEEFQQKNVSNEISSPELLPRSPSIGQSKSKEVITEELKVVEPSKIDN